MHAIANPADFEFQQEKVLSLAEQQVGDITVRTMVNSRTLEIAITYLRASFHRRSVNSLRARSTLVLHEQTPIAATNLFGHSDDFQ